MPALFPPSSFWRVRVVDHSPDLKIRRAFSSKIVTRGNSLNAKSEEEEEEAHGYLWGGTDAGQRKLC